jgi:hypothetical protein
MTPGEALAALARAAPCLPRTPEDACTVLTRAQWVMLDMGLVCEAQDAEQREVQLGCACRAPEFTPAKLAEVAHALADHVLPRGRRGRSWLVLLRPDAARAKAFTAAVLRAVRG